jgi:hypothetical protein
MRHTLKALAAGLVLVATLAARAPAQTPPQGDAKITVTGPAGAYTFKVEAGRPLQVVQSPTSILISWGATPPGPSPDPPPDPQPDPPPDPPPGPEPVAWGPFDRLLILYESTAQDGREPYRAQVVQAAMSELPKDGQGLPKWRIWDDDMPEAEPEWRPAFAVAIKDRGDIAQPQKPVLYAIDTAGRMKAFPADSSVTPETLADQIRKLARGGPGAAP